MHNLSFDIASLHAAYAAGTKPAEVIRDVYHRLEAADDPGIFIHLATQEQALSEVAALGPFDPLSKPLWGIPFAVKDNIDVAGMPTTAACPAYSYEATADAVVVAALRRAGAIPLGKTNLDQFATGLVGVRSPYPIPKNAVDPALVPGGSSSGSAVAVARGLVSFALGTDTAGSGRVPAALNNIVGLKPSLGAISATGVVPACRSLDTVSIFALTVADAYTAFRAAAGYDPDDPYARPFTLPPLGATPPQLRLGIPTLASRKFFDDTVQADSFSAALKQLEGLGAELVELDFTPFYQVAELLYEGAWIAERYVVLEQLLHDTPEVLHPVTRQIVEQGGRLSAADAFRGMYRLAALKREIQPLLDRVNMLCVPSIPTFYTLADLQADPIGPNSRLGVYTNFVNLLDMCGIAVPTAARTDGRPGSVTLLAAAGQDSQVAALGSLLQQNVSPELGATGWQLAEMTLPDAAQAQPGEIALAVVGAHLSGLPLNGELTRRGGRFLRSAQTAPNYRLYRLAGGPPLRPGLVRQAQDGAAIELEIWALPSEQFGAFISAVPQPLGIGTLTLADGTQVKGFICENQGLDGAEDITAYGGWRSYLASRESVSKRSS